MNELYDMGLAQNGKGTLITELSPIHGHGLFTTVNLPEKTILCRRLGLRSALSSRDKRAIIGVDGFDPANADDSIFKTINHSCHPNAWLTDYGCLVNFEIVAGGTEITIDYCSILPGSDWTIPCLCGLPDCRRLIKSI
jgi:hypothetical protein